MEANRMGTEFMERVRERAYQLWEAAGCEHGHEMEHWLRAEAQIIAEQATAQTCVRWPQDTSAPTPPTQADHADQTADQTAQKPKDSGKAAGKDHMETKTITKVASPIPRKTRSKKVAAS